MLVNKTIKSIKLTRFHRRAGRKASLEIIQTGFKKRCISNVLNNNEDDFVCGAEDTCEASNQHDFSGSLTRMQLVASTSEI